MAAKSLSRKLARTIVNLSYADLPPEVVERTKVSILNVLGACLAGRDLPWSRIAAQMAQKNTGISTVFGYGYKAAPAYAAMANAVMAHSVLLEDYAPGLGHPGISVIPAAIAVAEEKGFAGPDLITAIVCGYDVLLRTGLGLAGNLRPGFGESSVLATFGSAAAAAKLLKLNEDTTAGALAYAASSASGTLEHWIYGTMEGMFQVGLDAHNGVFFAHLAELGATAAETALEGRHGFYMAFTGAPDSAKKIPSASREFAIMRTLMKQYPSCGANQAILELGYALNQQYKIKAGDIDRIIERVAAGLVSGAGNDFSGPFANQFQAQMSSQFCLAAALLGKPVKSPDFYIRHFNDSEVLTVAQKIEMVPEEGRDWMHPRIEILFKNGKSGYSEEDCGSKFTPNKNTSKTVFKKNATPVLGQKKAAEVAAAVLSLESFGNVAALTDLLAP